MPAGAVMRAEIRWPSLRTPKVSPSPACGRRWPIGRMRVSGNKSHGLFSGPVSVIETRWLNILQHQELRKDTLIRPSGTFSRRREKGKPRDSSSLAPTSLETLPPAEEVKLRR